MYVCMYVCVIISGSSAYKEQKSKQTYKQTDEQTDKSKLHLQTTANYNTQCKIFKEYDQKTEAKKP